MLEVDSAPVETPESSLSLTSASESTTTRAVDATSRVSTNETASSEDTGASSETTTHASEPHAPELLDANGKPLPQTEDRPSLDSVSFKRRLELLVAAIADDQPDGALAAFFPQVAYAQVKAIKDPNRDWERRLVAAFTRNIREYHKQLGEDAQPLRFVRLEVPEAKIKRRSQSRSILMTFVRTRPEERRQAPSGDVIGDGALPWHPVAPARARGDGSGGLWSLAVSCRQTSRQPQWSFLVGGVSFEASTGGNRPRTRGTDTEQRRRANSGYRQAVAVLIARENFLRPRYSDRRLWRLRPGRSFGHAMSRIGHFMAVRAPRITERVVRRRSASQRVNDGTLMAKLASYGWWQIKVVSVS